MTAAQDEPSRDYTPSVEFVENLPDLPDKVLSVIRLKAAGADNGEIAQVLGLDGGEDAVERMIERALRKEMMKNSATREYARQLVRTKIEKLFQSVAGKAFNPNHAEHLAAVGKARELLAQEIRLLGLDAPTEVTVTTPDSAVIERFIQKMSGLESLPDEANLIDVEVISDDDDD